MMSITASPFTPVSSATPCITTTTTSTRSTNYALNSASLMSNLVRDASLDYDILCDFNCHGQNVNVKLSSGFYAAVAKPALCSISNGHSLTTKGIISSVSTSGLDTADINGLAVNRLLKITLRTASSPSCTLGTLTIHLHHTTRLIQIQGSFMMPDSTMAPIWFAENLLLPMFKERGAASTPHIQSINNAILSLKPTQLQPNPKPLPDNPSKKCGGCLKNFSGNACPMPCTACAKFFHKTSCWKSHHCGDLTAQGASSVPPAPRLSSFSALPPLIHRSLPVKRAAANITNLDIGSDDDDDDDATVMVDRQPALSIHPSVLPYTTAPLPSPYPSMSSTPAPTAPILVPDSTLAPVSQPPPKKKKKNSVPVSKDAIENELLRRELNAASAKITSLEREVKNYSEKCSILTERIKYFEEKQTQEIHEKYFSREQSPGGHTQTESTGSPSAPPATPSSSSPSSPASEPVIDLTDPLPPPTQPSIPSPAPARTATGTHSPPSASPPASTPSDPASSPGPTVNITTARLSVPQPSGHCNCTLELAVMRKQIENIHHHLAALTSSGTSVPPPSPEPVDPTSNEDPTPTPDPGPPTTVHNDGQPEVPGASSSSESTNSQASQTLPPLNTRIRPVKRKVLLNTPPAPAHYPRPPVWLPGRAPPPMPQSTASWPPRSSWSRSRPRVSRTPEPTVSDLIDLN